MNRYLHAIALCLLASTATYGMENSAQATTFKSMAQTIGTSIKRATQATYTAIAYVGNAIATSAKNGTNATTTKYQQMIDSQRTKAVQAYINATLDESRIYVKENPIKISLMAIGSGTVVHTAYNTTKALHRVIKKYRARHTTFCSCCRHEITKKEPKHIDPTIDTNKGIPCWLCANCHQYTFGETTNSNEHKH